MFQSESLQEKWKPLLNYEGLDEIKDPHRKAVTAVLLENQEKFLREESSFSSNGMLMEQPTVNTNSGSTAGFSAGASTPVAGFDPVLISLIRRSMPNLVAYDLAGVQPMSGPTGLIFAMRSRFTSQSGTEAFYNEVDTTFSGNDSNSDETAGFTDTPAGFGSASQQGSNPAILNPVGTAATPGYNVGQGLVTGDAENLGSGANAVSYTHLTLPTICSV